MPAWAAEVISVYDGDTFDAMATLGFHTYAGVTVRPSGYDAPELHNPGGQAARDYLAELAPPGFTVTLTAGEVNPPRSFARWVVTVRLPDGRDLAHAMTDAGHATPSE